LATGNGLLGVLVFWIGEFFKDEGELKSDKLERRKLWIGKEEI
jgi:hypothetical protein